MYYKCLSFCNFCIICRYTSSLVASKRTLTLLLETLCRCRARSCWSTVPPSGPQLELCPQPGSVWRAPRSTTRLWWQVHWYFGDYMMITCPNLGCYYFHLQFIVIYNVNTIQGAGLVGGLDLTPTSVTFWSTMWRRERGTMLAPCQSRGRATLSPSSNIWE